MPTYLLIDDDTGAAADAGQYAKALERAAPSLVVITMKPAALPQTLEAIATAAPAGVLLDIDLTNALDEDKGLLGFDGIALAQQIRTLQTRGRFSGVSTIGEIPLVRFSKGEVIREYVSTDPTSDDLFDEMIDKGTVVDHAAELGRRLLTLATDYPGAIALSVSEKTSDDLAKALGCSVEFLARLEPRTLLGLRRPQAPAHILARFFTARFLKRPGPIYDENVLAVRLGVDKAASEDWGRLIGVLSAEASYQGLFASGYPRWWHLKMLDWWATAIDPDRPPYRLTAEERVAALRQQLALPNLVALPLDPDSPGSKFWHRCQASGRPVDPARGFALLPTYDQESWQDADYLCEEEALRDRENARLGTSERSRLAVILATRKSL